MEHDIFICSCENCEHQLIFSRFKDEKILYLSIHLLPHKSVWKRLKDALKYIFGYKCKYGNFDEFIFKNEDLEKLQKIIDSVK